MSKKVNSIKGVRARQEVPEGDTWDLSLIFSNETLWENALASLKKEVPKLSAFRGTLSSKNKVLACLKLMHSLECNFEEIDELVQIYNCDSLIAMGHVGFASHYSKYLLKKFLTLLLI